MAKAGYDGDLGGIVATFNPLIMPYLLQLRESGNFTLADLDELCKLKSPSSGRIYWLLKEYWPWLKGWFKSRIWPMGVDEKWLKKQGNGPFRVLTSLKLFGRSTGRKAVPKTGLSNQSTVEALLLAFWYTIRVW